MSPGVLRGVVALVTAWATTFLAAHRLIRLPEPAEDSTGDEAGDSAATWHKPAYTGIMTHRAMAVVLVVATFLATLLVTVAADADMPWPTLVAWSVLAGAGGVLALCDLRTTYLPTALLVPVATTVLACFAATIALTPGSRRHLLASTFTALVIASGLFWLLWRMGGGMGLGDVRLVGVLALASAPVSFTTWYLGLLAGTCVGAVWGLATAWWRRRHPSGLGSAFPYGPALWLGAWLALLLR